MMNMMNRNDRHLILGVAPGQDTVVPEIRSNGRALPLWRTEAIASGLSAFVNHMVRRWISCQPFGTERQRRPNR